MPPGRASSSPSTSGRYSGGWRCISRAARPPSSPPWGSCAPRRSPTCSSPRCREPHPHERQRRRLDTRAAAERRSARARHLRHVFKLRGSPDMNANVATAAPAPLLLRRAGTLDTIVARVRREFWEHRSLWICALVVQGLLALALLFGRIDIDVPAHNLTPQQMVSIFTIGHWALAQPLYIV